MSSGTDIFHSALKIIGAYSIAAPADAEADIDMMLIYNSMVVQWIGEEFKNIGLNPIKVPGEEIGESEDIKLAIEYNLAVLAYPLFHTGAKPLSPIIKNTAMTLLDYVRKNYQDFTIPKRVVSSTLPRGEGNSRRFVQGPFFDRDETIGN